MTTNPFFDHYENAWINPQTDYGQHSGPCIGLTCDQLYERIDQWLTEFWSMTDQPQMIRNSIRVGILHRFYRD